MVGKDRQEKEISQGNAQPSTAHPQGTTSLSSASVIPGTRQSLQLSVLTPGHRPPTHPSAPAFQREAPSRAFAKRRDDIMHQQTGREIFPTSANTALPLQSGCQETETELRTSSATRACWEETCGLRIPASRVWESNSSLRDRHQ